MADPVTPERYARHGKMLFEKAASLGWVDDGGEGPFEFLTRTTYEVAFQDGVDSQHIGEDHPEDAHEK